MTAEVRVVGKYEAVSKGYLVDTTSHATEAWQRELSPFYLGPCSLYDNYVSATMENAWQYSKLYKEFADSKGNPTKDYWKWAEGGWNNAVAVRYPMGRGAKPLYSVWRGRKLGYIEARKHIYIPLYMKAVLGTGAFRELERLYRIKKLLVLKDFDGYDHASFGKTLEQVVNDPTKKMGHAFVLAMLLTGNLSITAVR